MASKDVVVMVRGIDHLNDSTSFLFELWLLILLGFPEVELELIGNKYITKPGGPLHMCPSCESPILKYGRIVCSYAFVLLLFMLVGRLQSHVLFDVRGDFEKLSIV